MGHKQKNLTHSETFTGQSDTSWEEDRFGSQILPIDAPDIGDDGQPADSTHSFS